MTTKNEILLSEIERKAYIDNTHSLITEYETVYAEELNSAQSYAHEA